MLIRPATTSDVESVLTLAKEFATSFVIDEASFRESFGRLLSGPDDCLLVAEKDGRVVGYALGFDHPTFFANGRVAWVEEIMVDADHRLAGVGRALMEQIENWARGRESQLIALATRRAAPFYQALGYQESATYFRKML